MKKNFKRFLSLAVAIVMMFAMFPVAAFAAEGNGAANVVRVTVSGNSETVEFASLQEALDFATAQSVGCTVYILDNITLTEPIVYRDSKADNVEMQSIKTGVNTYKLTSTFDEPMFTVEAGRFSIKNLVISSKGDAFQINGGSLALQGAYQGKQELYITSENGNCLSVAGGNTSIRANVYMTSNGREPVIAGTAGVGGNVTFHDWVATDPGVPQLTAPNAAMLISWPGEGTLSITQGYLDGENVVEPISDNVSITGGTFTAKPANWMIEDGYYCLPTADGKIWGVYPGTISVDDVWFASFDDAKASIKKDSKIVLYADAESNYGVGCAADYHFPGAGNLTLELNGFQFHSVKPADNKGTTTISMGPNSTLTITDSVGTGSIVFDNKGHPLVLSNNSKLYLPETIEFVGTIQLNYTNAQVFLGDTCILGQGGLVQTNVWGTKQFNNVNLDAEGNVTLGGGSFTLNADFDWADRKITIPADVVVDLNGNDLTAKEIVVKGALIDTADGEGAVVAEALTFNGQDNQGYLPLKDGDAYRLFQAQAVVAGAKRVNSDKAKVGFRVVFNKVDAYTLLADAANSEISKLEMSWTGMYEGVQGGSREIYFTNKTLASFAKDAAAQVAAGKAITYALTVNIEGLNKHETRDVLTFVPSLESCGVVITGAGVVYNYSR